MKLINIGFGTMVSSSRLIAVVSPESEKTYYDIPVIMQNKNIMVDNQKSLLITGGLGFIGFNYLF